jgi:hypothetical protein
MSDNVYRPTFPSAPPVAGGGTPPHDPGMEARVAELEKVVIRIDGKLDHLASKADVVAIGGRIDTLTERLHAHGETLTKVETAIRDLGSKVDAKMISGGQMFAIFISLMGAFFVFGGIAIGVLKYLGLLPHSP